MHLLLPGSCSRLGNLCRDAIKSDGNLTVQEFLYLMQILPVEIVSTYMF